MQINTVIPVISANSPSLPSEKLLNAILEAGVFRALVLQRQKGSVLLDTPWGRIRGKGPDTLNRGDEVVARLENSRGGVSLKIVQHVPSSVKLPARNLQQVFTTESIAPRVATVIDQRNTTTTLAIYKSVYRVSGLGMYDRGDRLMLKPLPGQQVEAKRIHPQTMLKAALSILLPRTSGKGVEVNPQAVRELAQAIDRGDMEKLVSQLGRNSSKTVTPASQPITHAERRASSNSPRAERIESGKPTGALTPDRQLTRIANILRSLATPLADMKSLDASTVQRILRTLGFSPTTTAENEAKPTLTAQLRNLLDAIKQHPDALGRILMHSVHNRPQMQAKTRGEQVPAGFEVSLRNEVQQQTESLLGQITAHKTTLSLQQETQQPLQLNLSLPLLTEQETRELKLRIREKKRTAENDEESHWEVQMSFEFGLLGLVTTRLQLHGQAIAAQFWAQQTSTKSLIEDNLDQFRAQLLRNGFEPGLLDCFHGSPTQPSEPDSPWPVSQNLLDLKA